LAIARFGENALMPDEAMANLRRKFVPVWLVHRYQVEAAAKLIGGVDYVYAVRGDGRPPATPVSPAAQRAALAALSATLAPAELTVPDRLVGLLSAGVNGRNDRQFDIEVLDNAGAAVFDPLVAADVAAEVTLDTLLAPSRLTRVYEQHRRDPSALGLDELIDKLFAASVDRRDTELGRRVAYRALLSLARAAHDANTSPDVAAVINARLQAWASAARGTGAGADAAWSRAIARILGDDDLLDKELAKAPRAPSVPPGMPIGAETDWMDDLLGGGG
jgi:hypothetical protein